MDEDFDNMSEEDYDQWLDDNTDWQDDPWMSGNPDDPDNL